MIFMAEKEVELRQLWIRLYYQEVIQAYESIAIVYG